MASSRLLFLFLISALVIALTEAGSKDLTVGKRQPNDHLISVDVIRRNPKFLQILRETKTFTGDNGSIISQVRLLDQNNRGKGAAAIVVGGGPGFRYVTVQFQSLRGRNIDYIIELYGR